ncbi:hypothetical protein ACWDTT_15890 [Streptosporangium sandarakinum]
MYHITITEPVRCHPWRRTFRNADDLVRALRDLDLPTGFGAGRGGTYWGAATFDDGKRVEWGNVPEELPAPADVRKALRAYIPDPVRLSVSRWEVDEYGDARVTITTVAGAHAIRGALATGDDYLPKFLTRFLGRHFLLESATAGRSLARITFVVPASMEAVFEAVA